MPQANRTGAVRLRCNGGCRIRTGPPAAALSRETDRTDTSSEAPAAGLEKIIKKS